MRSIWESYFAETDGVIFVIDCADKKQNSINLSEFKKLLEN
jgi:hypothetical protein